MVCGSSPLSDETTALKIEAQLKRTAPICRLRGIVVTNPKRSSIVPDIPTVAEAVPDYEVVNWTAVLGPKALPKNVVTRWNSEINKILRLPDVKERMAGLGMGPRGATGALQRSAQTRNCNVAEGGHDRQYQTGLVRARFLRIAKPSRMTAM